MAMDEGFDYGMDYGGGDLSEPAFDTSTETEWNNEYAEASELIDIEPESIDDNYIEAYSVSELLDQNQLEESIPEVEEEYSIPDPVESDLTESVADNIVSDDVVLPDDTEALSEEAITEENLEASDASDGVQSSENLSEWIGDINPNFDEFDLESPYSNNCGSCAYAVYQRLEGNPDCVADAVNIPYNTDMEALTGMEQVSMSPWDIEKTLLAEGEGAHAIIGIDRSEGPGHWFNAVNINGVVKAVDGQTGEITDWPPDYGDVVNWEMSVKRETLNG